MKNVFQVIGRQVGLVLSDHPAGEGEVESPSRSDDRIKRSVRLHGVKQTEQAEHADRRECCKAEEIRREGDQKLVRLVTAWPPSRLTPEPADASAHQQYPQLSVG